ncbi:GAF domain-containing protein [Thalassotalea euphylliae]|uniref:GAF domain-containing protein n=1 Tax=Thalassotalea euphylliae TaxID=1655234 RepID=A0A3E0TW23_9GAMM|nr:GAF domain-containing protein [Thalassotalea euphylliae]REL28195.1 GAF domain-containing protein [Thalassotalea euphylliae]
MNPANEENRIKSLQRLNLPTSSPQEKYDRLTRYVSKLFSIPIVVFSLFDKDEKWVTSNVGQGITQILSDNHLFDDDFSQDNVCVVPDTLADQRFINSPLVNDFPNIRFYVAQPIKSPDGKKIGALYLLGNKSRSFESKSQLQLKQVAAVIELELATRHSDDYCQETKLLSQAGFHQIANLGKSICRNAAIPLSFAYLYIKGLAGVKERDQARYRQILAIVVDAITKNSTHSDAFARYEDSGFVGFFSNTTITSIESKANEINALINQQLTAANITDIQVIAGLAEDDGSSPIEEIIFKAFMAHYRNANRK